MSSQNMLNKRACSRHNAFFVIASDYNTYKQWPDQQLLQPGRASLDILYPNPYICMSDPPFPNL